MQETKKCTSCNEIKPLTDYHFYKSGSKAGQPLAACKICRNARKRKWQIEHPRYTTQRDHLIGKTRPMSEARDCSSWLGIHVAERVLSNFFVNIQHMGPTHPGFDFLCGKGFKIDVKSSCLTLPGRKWDSPNRNSHWDFNIKRNKTADYFLLLAFNEDRESLKPLHVWLIPANKINQRQGVSITNTPRGLLKWTSFERPLDKVLICCDSIKEHNHLVT